MAYGRIRAENQLFFLNTSRVLGVQDYSINNNFGNFSLKYLGIGNNSLSQVANSNQYTDLSLNNLLIDDDIYIQQTGLNPINCFILKNNTDTNPYSFISGYLINYNTRYAPNQIPQITSSFRFYNNCGNVPTGNLDSYSFSQLSNIYFQPTSGFNNEVANCNYINLKLNEYSGNRVLDYGFSIGFNRSPIYNIGNRFPVKVNTIYPINIECDISFEADPSFLEVQTTDFPNNKTLQNIEIDVYSNSYNDLMAQYKFFNMTLVGSNSKMNVDGNLTIIRKYVGQIFNINNNQNNNSLDFGLIINSPGLYLDWGQTTETIGAYLDFGSA